MTFPLPVQRLSQGGTSGNGTTFDLAAGWEPPAAGNLIVVFTGFAVGTRNLTIPTGYTSIGVNSGGGGGGRPKVGCFGKIADGTESSVLVEWSGGADQWVGMVQEYDAQSASVAPANTGDGGNGSNISSLGSGLTSSVEGYGTGLFISHAQNSETPSYSNGFVHDTSVLAGGANDLVLDIANSDANENVAGQYSTSATWSGTSNRSAICVAVDVVYIQGEKLKSEKYTKEYRVINRLNGQVPFRGNWGQCRKEIAKIQDPQGTFKIKIHNFELP